MINATTSKNTWNIGDTVSIGFMKNLKVLSVRAEKDFLPDIYTLQAVNGQKYEFIPHNGLYKIYV